MSPHVHLIPEAPCPQCGESLNVCGDLEGTPRGPQTGDVTVCLNCCAVLAFRPDLTLRLAGEAEVQTLLLSETNLGPVLTAARAALHARRARNAGPN